MVGDDGWVELAGGRQGVLIPLFPPSQSLPYNRVRLVRTWVPFCFPVRCGPRERISTSCTFTTMCYQFLRTWQHEIGSNPISPNFSRLQPSFNIFTLLFSSNFDRLSSGNDGDTIQIHPLERLRRSGRDFLRFAPELDP